MEPRWQSRLQSFQYVMVLAMIAGVLVFLRDADDPKEYRGTLHYPVMAPGGETTGVVIVTPAGAYDLDLDPNLEWRRQLANLNGKEVVVTGELTLCRGVEVRDRRIIRVDELKAATSDEDPGTWRHRRARIRDDPRNADRSKRDAACRVSSKPGEVRAGPL